LALTHRTPEQEADVFRFKREMVMEYVERVDVKPDKSIALHFKMTLTGAEPDESGPKVYSDQEPVNELTIWAATQYDDLDAPIAVARRVGFDVIRF
jgi:hypothetical protein